MVPRWALEFISETHTLTLHTWSVDTFLEAHWKARTTILCKPHPCSGPPEKLQKKGLIRAPIPVHSALFTMRTFSLLCPTKPSSLGEQGHVALSNNSLQSQERL